MKTEIKNHKQVTTLDKIKIGQRTKVHQLLGTGMKKRKLAEMGITPRTDVWVKRIAPLGDPIEITLRGYELSLRLDDAKEIEVTVE